MLRGSGRYAPATPPLLATRPGKSRGLWKVRVAAESCYYALDGVSVVGWRSLHALPSTSACCRRQAPARHYRLAGVRAHDNRQLLVHAGGGQPPDKGGEPMAPAPPPEPIRDDKGQIMRAVEPMEISPSSPLRSPRCLKRPVSTSTT